MDVVTGLDQAWTAIRHLLRSLGADDWSRQTACSDWKMRDMAAHFGAVEGGFLGFEQPPVPEGWTTSYTGVDAWTAQGVAARREWSTDELIAEVDRVAEKRMAQLQELDDDGWQQPTMGPLGETTLRGLMEIRLFDVYVHLLDMRWGLGRPLVEANEEEALDACVQRAVQLTPWGAVKKTRLPDGTRVRLDLSGPSATLTDVVVEGGRGAVQPAVGDVDDVIEGTATAYLLAATGREQAVERAGGVRAKGPAATALLERYRLFG